MAIGEAHEYIVTIENALSLSYPGSGDLSSATPLHDLPWSSISWQRVEDSSSSAKIVVGNDPQGQSYCPRQLTAWSEAIAIRRNGVLVWWGPIIGWRYNPDNQSVEIAAKDILELLPRAFIPTDYTATNEYPGVVISWVINALAYGNLYMWQNMDPQNIDPDNYATYLPLIDRTWAATRLVDGQSAITDILSEIDGSMTAVGNIAHIGYRYLDPITAQASGHLSETTVLNRPVIVVDASNCATSVLAINGAFGGTGVAYVDDVLVYMENYDTAVAGYLEAYSATVLQRRVSGDGRDIDYTALVKGFAEAADALAPHVTMEQLILDPSFGADLI